MLLTSVLGLCRCVAQIPNMKLPTDMIIETKNMDCVTNSYPCDSLVGDNKIHFRNAWQVKCIAITCVLLHVVKTE